mmetsp:Transcript_70954/g.164030  ORF Transcript_70954/g.164030 Transcript_70954/m.164030 type:complete len:377 (-) Transcript_70954:180-1310(-)
MPYTHEGIHTAIPLAASQLMAALGRLMGALKNTPSSLYEGEDLLPVCCRPVRPATAHAAQQQEGGERSSCETGHLQEPAADLKSRAQPRLRCVGSLDRLLRSHTELFEEGQFGGLLSATHGLDVAARTYAALPKHKPVCLLARICRDSKAVLYRPRDAISAGRAHALILAESIAGLQRRSDRRSTKRCRRGLLATVVLVLATPCLFGVRPPGLPVAEPHLAIKVHWNGQCRMRSHNRGWRHPHSGRKRHCWRQCGQHRREDSGGSGHSGCCYKCRGSCRRHRGRGASDALVLAAPSALRRGPGLPGGQPRPAFVLWHSGGRRAIDTRSLTAPALLPARPLDLPVLQPYLADDEGHSSSALWASYLLVLTAVGLLLL